MIVPFPSNRVFFPAALRSLPPAANVFSLLFLPLALSYQIAGQMQPHFLSFDKTSHISVKFFFFTAYIFPKRRFLLPVFFRVKGFSYGAAAGKGIAFGIFPCWRPAAAMRPAAFSSFKGTGIQLANAFACFCTSFPF